MPSNELSVAITGKDTLSPALANVERSLTRTRGQMQQTATTVEVSSRRMQGAMSRAAFGIQSFSMAAQNGRVSLQGLSSALIAFGPASGAIGLALAGFSALVAVLTLVRDRAKDARDRLVAAALAGGEVNTAGAYTAWMVAAQEAFEARGTSEFSRLNAEAERLGRRFTELARMNERVRALQGHQGGGATGGRSGNRDAPGGGDVRLTPRPSLPDFDPVADFFREKHGKGFDWAAVFPPDESFSAGLDNLDKYKQGVEETSFAMQAFGSASEMAFGALIDAAASGGNVLQAFTRAALSALGREARTKAIYELAEGFAALFNPFKGGPAAAATHFKAAALYGAVAVGAGIAAGGGGGGGFSSGVSRSTPGFSGSRESQRTVIIQIVGHDGRELSRTVATENARYANRGGSIPGQSANITRVPVDGAVVVQRGFR